MNGERLLVFVGAGLTKALQRPEGPRVPAMGDFIAVLADHLDDPVILTTLADLDRASAYDHPQHSAARLAKAKPDTSSWTDRDRAAYRDALIRRPAENIEAILERAHALTAGSANGCAPEAEFAPKRFEYAINRLFAVILDQRLNMEPVRRLVESRPVATADTATFVSFNYDLALDQALSDARLFLPAGYGVPFAGYVPPSRLEPHADQRDIAVEPLDVEPLPNEPESRATVIKPHGSLNWLFPSRKGLQPIVVVTKEGRPSYSRPFRLGTVRWPDGQVSDCEPFLVPPSEKNIMTAVRQSQYSLERAALLAATQVWVIGWSLPGSDKDQEGLLRRTTAQRQKNLAKVVVVNKGAEASYFARVAEALRVAPGSLECHNDGVDGFLTNLEAAGSTQERPK